MKTRTEFMQTANLLTTELQLIVEGSNIYLCIAYQTILTLKLKKAFKKLNIPYIKPGLKSSFDG